MEHGLLHWYEPSELDSDQQQVYEAIVGGPRAASVSAAPLADASGRLPGPFNAMLVSARVGMALQALGAALRYGSNLPDRLRELAVLAVAAGERSEYEWHVHGALARAAGVTPAEQAALLDGGEPPTLSPDEQLALRVVREVAASHRLDAGLAALALERLGEVRLVELVTLVGYYQCLATTMHVFRTPLPEGAQPQLG